MIANHLWQSTVFAAVAALCVFALRGNRARTRHWLWLAASLKFLFPFAILAALGSQAGSHIAVRPAAAAPVILQLQALAQPAEWGTPLPGPSNPLPSLALAAWATGSLFLSGRWFRRWWIMRVLARAARPIDLALPIPVRSSPAAVEPGVFGIFRPVLLLPEGIAERLTPEQFRAILAHELCHVRRRDNLWASAHMLVETLFWFHPLVWWIGARMVEERERACDEEVVQAGGGPEAYAEAILAACRLYLESPLPCVAGVGGGNLRRRVERIMSAWTPRELSRGCKTFIAAAAAVVLAVPIAVGFLRAPVSLAQAQAERPKFEVASIKPANPRLYRAFHPLAGGRLSAEGTLQYFMMSAYEMQEFRIIGAPGWVRSDRYHIEAKAQGDAPREQVLLMSQTLLEDRFQLRYHRETREQPVYELLIAKNGPKLRASEEEGCVGSGPDAPPVRSTSQPPRPPCGALNIALAPGGAHMLGSRISMREFTRMLAMTMGRQIIDRTGMSGSYEIDLRFTPDSIAAGLPPLPPANSPASPDSGPSIVTALPEQLGLKLDAAKGPVEVMVIDHVERPSEN